jgi:hypothetical protein
MAVPSACANVDLTSIYARASALAMGLDTDTYQSRLIYRTTDQENIDLSAAFVVRDSPLLFSWHADLEAEGVVLSENKTAWTATLEDSTWSVNKKTGVLQRLSVGTDALVLDNVVRGKKATPMHASETCPTTTSAAAERGLTDQFRLYSLLPPYSALVEGWNDLEPAKRAEALAGLQAWWTTYFADELPAWLEGLDPSWKVDFTQRLSDPATFAAFRDELPADAQAGALEAWKSYGYRQLTQGMMEEHFVEVATQLTEILNEEEAFDDGDLRPILLLGPLQAALQATAGPVLDPPVRRVVEAAGASLETSQAK